MGFGPTPGFIPSHPMPGGPSPIVPIPVNQAGFPIPHPGVGPSLGGGPVVSAAPGGGLMFHGPVVGPGHLGHGPYGVTPQTGPTIGHQMHPVDVPPPGFGQAPGPGLHLPEIPAGTPDHQVAGSVAEHLSNALALVRDPELKASLSNAIAAVHKHLATVHKEHLAALGGKHSARVMASAHNRTTL